MFLLDILLFASDDNARECGRGPSNGVVLFLLLVITLVNVDEVVVLGWFFLKPGSLMIEAAVIVALEC